MMARASSVQRLQRASLKSDALAYGAAIAVDRFSSLMVLPLLTSIMDRSTFGAWNQVLTAFALLSNILELGFYHSILRYVPGADRPEVGRIFYSMLLLVLCNCAIFFGLTLAAPDFFSRLLFAQSEAWIVIVAASGFIVTECLFEFVVMGFLRADGRVRVCAFYYALKNIARLFLLWLGAINSLGLGGLLELLSGGTATLALIAYAFHVAPHLPVRVFGGPRGFWAAALRYSGAMVLSTNLSWANVSLNRFLIVYLLGLSELGLYAANYSIASIVNVVAVMVNFIVVPHLNKAWNDHDTLRVNLVLTSITRYYCFATFPAVVAICVFYTPIIRLLASAQYQASPALIWALCIFMVLIGLEQFTTFATFLDNSRFSVCVRGISLILNVSLNLVFLKTMGIVGAALAASIAAVLVIGLNCRFLLRMTGYEVPWRAVGAIVVASVAMAFSARAILILLPAPSFAYAVVAGVLSLPIFFLIESSWSGSVTRELYRLLCESFCRILRF